MSFSLSFFFLAKHVITTQSEPVRFYWFLLSAGFTGPSRRDADMQTSRLQQAGYQFNSSKSELFEYSKFLSGF